MRKTVHFIKALLLLFLFLSTSLRVYAQEIPSVTITPLGKTINTKKYTEYAPTLSANGKVMVFQSDHNKYRVWYLYESTLGANGKWSKPKPIDAINNFGQKPQAANGFQTDFIATPHLSADGNTLYFCATFSGGLGSKDIYLSKRKSDGSWGRPQNVGAPINTKASEDFPSISPEGDALYFARPNGASKGEGKGKRTCYDLYVAKKNAETGAWQKPQKLPSGSINTGCEKCPRIQSDGLTLVFSSMRESNTYPGDFDLYKAVLGVKETNWEQLETVTPLNTKGFDQFVTVIEPVNNPKSTTVFYNADGKKTPDVFQASPLPEMLRLQKVINTQGKVLAKSKAAAIPYVASNTTLKVYLLEAENGRPYLLKTIKVDEATGGFSLPLRFGYDYLLIASVPDTSYNTAQKRLILKDWTSLEYAIKEPLMLIKKEQANPRTTTTTTTEVIAKNNGTRNGKSTNPNTNTNTNTGSNSIASNSTATAQKTLLINRKTGEIISVAELNERKRKNSNKGIQVANGVGDNTKQVNSTNNRNKGEILAAYPEFESFDSKQQQLSGGTQALTSLKFPHLRFAYKSAELSSQSQAYLENILALLKASPRSKLQIDAHTDHTGTWSSNMRLSAKRAAVVKEFLTKNGINETRLKTKAYGEGKPLVWHVDAASQKKNRRVEVYFLK